MSKGEAVEILSIEGREVRVTHPDKLYFSRQTKLTKLDIVQYYLAVSPGALAGIRDRPLVLKRFVNGAEEEPFYQKRAPKDRPDWLNTVTLSFPSGRTAEELVVRRCRRTNLDREFGVHRASSASCSLPRISIIPTNCESTWIPGRVWPGPTFVRFRWRFEQRLRRWGCRAGRRPVVRAECTLSSGFIRKWTFTEVRRAALALSREVERRVPDLASSKWWKEERHGVFLDYNQNAKDRTTASAYSVRPLPDARVSAPLLWDEVAACDPADFTVLTMPKRFEEIGNPHADADSASGSLDKLLELAERDEASGLGDAPWPPHFRKTEGEAKRVAPSRAKKGPPASAAKVSPRRAARTKAPLAGRRKLTERRSCIGRTGAMERQAHRSSEMVGRRRHPGRSHERPVVDLDAYQGEPAPRTRGIETLAGDS